MATTDFAGTARFCYTGTLPGDDTIGAFADTNNNQTQDVGEPGDTATKTWTGEPPTHHLTVSKAGTGTGTVTSAPAGITCGATCAADFGDGTSVVLTATPDAGSVFTGWTGDCTGTGTCTLTMSADHTVTATFDTAPLITHHLTVSKAGTGTGTVTSAPAGITCGATCAADFGDGTSVVLTATPDAGSVFTGWTGDCTGTGTCTLTMSADHTVTATFERRR